MLHHRHHRLCTEVDEDDIRLLARFNGTDAVREAERFCAVYGCHAQHAPGRHYLRIHVLDFVKQSRKLHFVDNLIAVVAGSLIGAKRRITSSLHEFPCRGNFSVNNADAAGAEHHGSAALCKQTRFFIRRIGNMRGNQLAVQIAQLLHKRDGTLVVALHHLNGFALPLR